MPPPWAQQVMPPQAQNPPQTPPRSTPGEPNFSLFVKKYLFFLPSFILSAQALADWSSQADDPGFG